MKNTRRHVISIVLTAVLIATLFGTIVGLGLSPKLGLDLRGGLALTLTGPEETRSDVLDKTVEILRRRIDAAGVAEPEIAREGKNNISIQLPGSGDSRRLLALIGRTAQLQFRQVQQTLPRGTPQFASATVTLADDPAASVVLLSKDGNEKLQLGPAELTGEVVKRGVAIIDQGDTGSVGGWQVQLSFTGEGAKKWKEFTGRLACQQGDERQIAIVLDQDVESHPQVATDVQCNEGIANGNTVITGNFTEREAKELALVLTTGALPVKLEQSEVRIVSPTLGKDSLRAGLLAGALGLALVFLYVLAYYRTLGLQTWLGLVAFSSIVYGLIVGFGALIGWNLTLAGIAGLIVSIGIATDSYIVFFERVKEEVHEGRTLPSSIDKGFKHAWRTMLTANMVTILAAVVLYLLTVGSVRGFALALGMATTIDLAVTYALTWPLASLLARSSFFGENKVFGMRRALEGNPKKKGGLLAKIYRSEFAVDFIGRRRIWLTISAVVVGLSIVIVLPGVRGLTYGIDFKGGNVFRAPLSNGLEADPIKSALREEGVSDAVVQVIQDRVSKNREVEVQTEADKDPAKNAIIRTKVADALAKVTGAPVADIATDSVDKKWGAQITAKALRGLVVFLVLVILYMSWRLEPKMAIAGIVALLHDVLITIGVYALVGFEVSPATVIATLTILGFSLYDTVVVFDKIRENQALSVNARKSFGEIANDSTNQVLMRSINTSLTVLLPVGSLLFVGSALLGATTLKDLSLALFVGVAAGTYSSIFVATPLLSIWKEKEPRYQNIRAKVLRPTESAPPEPVGATTSGSTEPLTTRSSPQVKPSGPRRNVSRAKRKKR
ncbi:MAG TPA: protein translocase subunit SecF [Actinomycetota bacterium]|nr:protein translocase subunit SecF [Actinomycetota bacterium]